MNRNSLFAVFALTSCAMFKPRPRVMMGAYPQSIAGAEVQKISIEHDDALCMSGQPEKFAIDVTANFTASQSAAGVAGVALLHSATNGDHPYPIEKEYAFQVTPSGTAAWNQGDGGLWLTWKLPDDALPTEEVVVSVSSVADPSRRAERHFKPDYHCVTSAGVLAGTGQPGIRLTAEATIVSTSVYPRLVAVIVRGGNRNVVRLFHPDQHAEVFAGGGWGEDGARGQNGGNGGDGGSMELVYDKRFPELASILQATAPGGKGGQGARGAANGRDGKPGTARMVAGKIAEADFAALPGVQLVRR